MCTPVANGRVSRDTPDLGRCLQTHGSVGVQQSESRTQSRLPRTVLARGLS